jgi:cell wall assembly regulator SMI1
MDHDQDPEAVGLIDRLRRHWLQNGIKIRNGLSLQQIESFESSYAIRIPPDLRTYYATMDGMEEGETDSEMFSFLPLESVKSIPERLARYREYSGITKSLTDSHCWFVTVDYVLTSMVYAVYLSSEPVNSPVRCICGNQHRIVAPSFSDFLEANLANSLDLLL